MRSLLLAAAVSALLLSGCSSGGGGRLSDAEAREAAQKAMEDFVEDFASGDGDIRTIEGTFEVSDEAWGDADVDFELERGRGDTLLLHMEVGGSGLNLEADVFCSPTLEVLSYGQGFFASRPSVEESCMGSGIGEEAFDIEGLEEADIEDVEAHSDGSVTARFSNETGEFTMEVDPRGRLTKIELESEEGSGAFDITYGSRRSLEPPADEEDLQYVPADIQFMEEESADGVTWTVLSSPQEPPVGEFEMQFQEGDTVVASVGLADGLSAQGEYLFAFDDADGDGRITEGDVLTFGAPEDSSAQPALFDTWAGANVGEDNMMPGFGLLAGLAALGAVAALARRRL